MSAPHLLPAAAALIVAAVALACWYQGARRAEARAVYALASADVPRLALYRAPQVEAFRHPDLLPIYGSSEVLFGDTYRADRLFRMHRAGFLPFPAGLRAGTPLMHLQKLTGIGRSLHGKKVVISFTYRSVLQDAARAADAYAGNYSPVDANGLAFSTDLSFAVKAAAARRMLQYPEPLQTDPLLGFALRQLADDSLGSAALYYAALPLGRLQCLVLRIQDHWATQGLIREQAPGRALNPGAAGPLGPPEVIDWEALATQAERDYRRHADNNPFGIDNKVWSREYASQETAAAAPQDEQFLRRLDRAPGWEDLDLLVRGLRELGAEPVLLSPPLKGNLFAYRGISAGARAAYYTRLRTLARAHGVPVVDFADHDGDTYFLLDSCHLSPRGWVYYARALDTLYRLPPGGHLAPAPLPGADPPRNDSPGTSGRSVVRQWDATDLLTTEP